MPPKKPNKPAFVTPKKKKKKKGKPKFQAFFDAERKRHQAVMQLNKRRDHQKALLAAMRAKGPTLTQDNKRYGSRDGPPAGKT